jgi:hypothetical protein
LRYRGVFTCESVGQLVGLLGRVIGPTQGLYLHTEQHNTEKRRHTSMPRASFEPAISTSERPKTVLASDRSAIETGYEIEIRDIISAPKCEDQKVAYEVRCFRKKIVFHATCFFQRFHHKFLCSVADIHSIVPEVDNNLF